MLSRLFVLFSLVLPLLAHAEAFNEGDYTAYTGDIQNDSCDDIYLEANKPFIILAGEISIPLQIPSDKPNLLLNGVSSGGACSFDAPIETADLDTSSLSPTAVNLLVGDYNNDGLDDLLVQSTAVGGWSVSLSGQSGAQLPAILSFIPQQNNVVADVPVPTTLAEALAAVTVDPIASAAVGSTGGSFRVTETGSAVYSIPLTTFAGTAGVAPEVSLNYNSQYGNGVMGLGWSISGLSGIGRCRQTVFQDGIAKPISWSEDDRFCLDGQRLIVDAPYTYGQIGATYKTEIDSFVRVESVGGALGHPASFTVYRKDGSVSYYGANDIRAKSLLKARNADGSLSSNVYMWAIDQFIDNEKYGNAINFTYLNDVNGQSIKHISYAFGTNANTNDVGANATVSFYYNIEPTSHAQVTQAARLDPSASYVAGYKFQNNRRLHIVESTNKEGSDTGVVQYTLNYNEAPYDAMPDTQSRLTSIQECNNGVCLSNKTRFEWPKREVMVDSTELQAIDMAGGVGVNGYVMADINGDGAKDIAWLRVKVEHITGRDQFFEYALSSQGQFTKTNFYSGVPYFKYEENPSNNELVKMEVLDYNADGRDDIVVYNQNSNKWTLYLSSLVSGGEWRLQRSSVVLPFTAPEMVFADVSADGLVDAIHIHKSNADINVFYMSKISNSVSSTNIPYEFLGTASTINMANHFSSLPSDPDYTNLPGLLRYPTVNDNIDISFTGLGDFNADGKIDLLLTYKYITSTPPSDVYYVNTQLVQVIVNLDDLSFTIVDSIINGIIPTQVVDVNADGASDIVLFHSAAPDVLINRGDNTYELPLPIPTGTTNYVDDTLVQFYDLNLDGYPDFIYTDHAGNRLKVKYWDPALDNYSAIFSDIPQTTVQPTCYLGGRRFSNNLPRCESNYVTTVTSDVGHTYISVSTTLQHSFDDIDGDGLPDYIVFDIGLADITTSPSVLSSSPGNGIVSIESGMGAVTDIYYDRMSDSDHYTGFNTATASAFYTELNTPYAGLLSGSYLDSHSMSPYQELKGPIPIVTYVQSSSPTATNTEAMASISYHYTKAKMQAGGRGLLGFKTLQTVDEQTGIKTTTEYRQDWPFIGYPLSTEVVTATNKMLSQSHNEQTFKVPDLATGQDINTEFSKGSHFIGSIQPYVAKTVETVYPTQSSVDITGLVQTTVGTAIQSTTVTNNTYDDYGNPASIVLKTYAGSESGTPVSTVTSTNEYTPAGWLENDARRYGRLSKTIVLHERDGQTAINRVSAFEYATMANGGVLTAEITEPDDADLTQTKRYTFDSFGNHSTAVVEVTGETNRSSSFSYDSTGRYINQTTNGFGQVTQTVISRNNFGAPTVVENIDGISHTSKFDAAGTQYFSYSESGAYSASFKTWCSTSNNCPADAVFSITNTSADGGQTIEYHDILGRVIHKQSIHFDGTSTVKQDIEYDILGRVVKSSEPYIGGAASYWSVTEYDVFGRAIRVTAADGSIATTEYDGLVSTTTNALGQTRETASSVLGDTVKITDHLNSTIDYIFDSQGNMTEVITASINRAAGVAAQLSTTIDYDKLGRKTHMHDLDKGHWYYQYNGFGELILQVDGNGQCTATSYDKTGRMLTRQDYTASTVSNGIYSCSGSLQGNTSWVYNNSTNTSSKGLGQLQSVSDSYTGYQQTPTYDSLGRVSETATTLGSDGTYYEKVTYDQFGRTFQVFDGARHTQDFTHNGVQHHYNNAGYLYRVSDAEYSNGAPKNIYYQVDSMNARGQTTLAYLSDNRIAQTSTYDDETGRLTAIDTLNTLVQPLQNLTLVWDDIGNLTSKHNQGLKQDGTAKNLQESYCYDSLNRLVKTHSASLTGSCAGFDENNGDVTYDGYGNIKQKTGLGAYTYGTNAGPHAVTNIGGAGGIDYSYDANGNQLTGDGRTVTYHSFGKVKDITKGNHNVEFTYGPDRSRYKRIDSENSAIRTTTLYIGGVEKIINAQTGHYSFKRYINGVAIETDKFDANGNAISRELNYTFKDNLGSTDAITDVNGQIIEQSQSFDAWGQRRNSNTWAALSASELTNFDHSITTRGFTGHEMLDEVGVIHMNGRIYDPKIGRFMQADTIVDGVTNTQGYNRYSYVQNNPLNATDPSGHFSLRRNVGTIIAVAGAIYCGGCGKAVAIAIGATAGAVGAAAVGGNVFKGALIGGLSAAAFDKIGTHFEKIAAGNNSGFISVLKDAGVSPGGIAAIQSGFRLTSKQFAAKIVAHGVVGGVGSSLSGGKFGHGFASAAFTQAFAPTIDRIEAKSVRLASAAVVGGTASKLSGGKFANGAFTAVFSRAFNDERTHGGEDKSKVKGRYMGVAVHDIDISNINTHGRNPEDGPEIYGNLTADVSVEFGARVECSCSDAVWYPSNNHEIEFSVSSSLIDNPWSELPGIGAARKFFMLKATPVTAAASKVGPEINNFITDGGKQHGDTFATGICLVSSESKSC